MDSSFSPSFQGSGLRSKCLYSRLMLVSNQGGLSLGSKSNIKPVMYRSVSSAPSDASRTREVFLLASWLAQKRWWPAVSWARRRAPALVRGSTGDRRVEYWGVRVCGAVGGWGWWYGGSVHGRWFRGRLGVG